MRFAVLGILLLIELAAFAPYSGVRFGSSGEFVETAGWYLENLIVQTAPLCLLAFGMTLVLMTAGIDLSVGSLVALVGCVMSIFPAGPSFWFQALPAGLLVAVACGAFNGLLISRLIVPPIIATLGSLFFFRGLCQVVIGSRENAPFLDVPGFSHLATLPGAAGITAVLLLPTLAWFARSRFRRELRAIGGNPIAARFTGLRIERRLLTTYFVIAVCAFAAAVLMTARDGSIKASSYQSLELQVIVAVVLGGTRVTGGQGSVAGSLLGVALIAVLDEGLRGLAFWLPPEFPFQISHMHYIIMGSLLVGGVWMNQRWGDG